MSEPSSIHSPNAIRVLLGLPRRVTATHARHNNEDSNIAHHSTPRPTAPRVRPQDGRELDVAEPDRATAGQVQREVAAAGEDEADSTEDRDLEPVGHGRDNDDRE